MISVHSTGSKLYFEILLRIKTQNIYAFMKICIIKVFKLSTTAVSYFKCSSIFFKSILLLHKQVTAIETCIF